MSVEVSKVWEIVRNQTWNLGGLQDETWTLRISDEDTPEDEPAWSEYELRDGAKIVAKIVEYIVKKLDEEELA